MNGVLRILQCLFRKVCEALRSIGQTISTGFQAANTARNGRVVYAQRRPGKTVDLYKGESANITPAQSVYPDPIYFQLFYRESARRRAYLETTHEPDEIETQMKLYVPVIHLQTKVEIDAFKTGKKISQKYLSGEFSDLLKAIKYAEKHEPKFNPFPMLDATFAEYNPPSNVEELLLKAEIADDKKWADFWRKYMTA